MTHPTTAPGGWKLAYIVYPGSPGEMAVGVLQRESHRMMGVRWCEAGNGADTWQEGMSDWVVLPFTFAAAISRSLLQMKATGFTGFDQSGLQKLIEWMTDYDHHAVDDCICYPG